MFGLRAARPFGIDFLCNRCDPKLLLEKVISTVPIPILWKTSDVEDKRARSMRRFYIGVGVSLLFHALLMMFVPRPLQTGNPPDQSAAKGPLVVQLTPRAVKPPTATESPTEPVPPPSARPPPAPRMMAVPKTLPQNPTIPLVPLEPLPKLQTPPDIPEPSMMAMVEAARARRRAAEQAAQQSSVASRSNENPSGGDAAAASLNRNLQSLSGQGGTSGVFQILHKGHRSGQFAFRGFNAGVRGNWKEVIDVDAGPQGDLEIAMVRKMIELIREHYKGNFNWESHRMGRVVVLSARLEDSGGLEAFLMREFFSPGR